MPFKKGQSGCPNGGVISRKMHQKRLVTDLLGPNAKRAADEVAAQLDNEDPYCRQWAAKLILEYCFGKPAQAVEVTGEDGGPIQLLISDA